MLTWLLARKRYGGLVAGHGLQKWWSSLSEEERSTIRQHGGKLGDVFHPLDREKSWTSERGTKPILVDLARLFERDDLRALGRKIMAHAESLPNTDISMLNLHFMFHGMIGFYYRCRNDGPDFLPLCEQRCRDMIEVSKQAAQAMRAKHPKGDLPVHSGYGRLCWLLDKRGDPEAAKLRNEGESQGWIVSI